MTSVQRAMPDLDGGGRGMGAKRENNKSRGGRRLEDAEGLIGLMRAVVSLLSGRVE